MEIRGAVHFDDSMDTGHFYVVPPQYSVQIAKACSHLGYEPAFSRGLGVTPMVSHSIGGWPSASCRDREPAGEDGASTAATFGPQTTSFPAESTLSR